VLKLKAFCGSIRTLAAASKDNGGMPLRSVLIVDDDASIRTMVRTVLQRGGFEVEEVGSGNQAIARIREKLYDAVVLDIMMGNGSGQDVLQALALERPNQK
jgi:CheY-like chemotaxis protein